MIERAETGTVSGRSTEPSGQQLPEPTIEALLVEVDHIRDRNRRHCCNKDKLKLLES